MNSIKYAMIGAAGRMGETIIALAQKQRTADGAVMQLVGALEHPESSALDKQALAAQPVGEAIAISSDAEAVLKNAQVAIDFSSPANTLAMARICAEQGVGLVVGTTGFNDTEMQELKGYADRIALLIAPNMSIGVNLLFELTRLTARILGDTYDVEVVEAHHHHKKDAPSGTATRLRDVLLESLGRTEEQVIYGRHGMVGARPEREIAMHTLRGGDVVGDHTVYFFGEGERLELTHRASSRNTFASGALHAAASLANKKPGLYNMLDVLGLQEL